MIDLLPRDHWEHNFTDFLESLALALISRKGDNTLTIPELGKCIPVRSGRAGIVAAIQALDLPPGARIGVPLYCCPVVFKAITVAGCTPCFVDVEPDTFCMAPGDLSSKISQLHAVIAVHMFGNMCDIPELKTVSQGKPIIEDCAQALGSKLDGQPAGSFGDISFFSFRSGKYLSVGEGGALFSRNIEILSRVGEIVARMNRPGRTDEIMHVAKTAIKSVLRNRPVYGILGYPLWSFASKKRNSAENTHVALSQVLNADLNLTKKRLPRLNEYIEGHRSNAQFYSRAIALPPGMLCTEKPGAFYNRYLYPLTFASVKERDGMAAYLLGQGIDTMKYIDDVLQTATDNFGYTGGCPVAEGLSKRVLIIPNYYSLNKQDIQHVAHCLNDSWAEINKSNQESSL